MPGALTRLAAALAVAAGPLLFAEGAAAQARDDDAVLPRAEVGVWSVDRLRKSEPPFLNGAVAQVRERQGGRFAVICERGDSKGFVAWRAPQGEARGRLRERGDRIEVEFTFDRGQTITRNLRWDEDGRYWTTRFGPDSRLAQALKASFDLRVRVPGSPVARADYSLDGSWRSIARMFEICRM